MDRYIGKLLDNRYEILERIGTGGMAVVYKAKCHRLNRLVAVKILKEDLAQDAEFRRRFHDESQAVAMLSHPNIVAVYDVSKSSELDYIVMELIDGITLKQYMQKKGNKLTWREALHFITQIMKALSHAHSRGIIHRDIKPHNMMVLRDGSLKVADFGIARLTSAAQATLTQEALGSVHYISPEQARGSHIDARSDIYSAGVVLYEMTTGRLPYEGDSPVSVAIQHINSIPLSPREIDPDIPEALEAITMKAMASDVNQRYISADAMLADLEEFRKNPNINFDFTPADLLVGEGDEPTQVLGANTPHTVRSQPAHGSRLDEPTTRRRRREVYDDEDDYYEDERRDGIRGKLPVILAACAIVVFVIGICYFLYASFFSDVLGGAQEISAPSVVGMTVDQAQSLEDVVQYNLVIKEGGRANSDTYPAGQIMDQDPAAESTMREGGTITVTVSAGAAEVDTIPDVYNKDKRVAKSTLENLGLVVVLEEEYDEAIAQDCVISQSPAAGTPYEEGDTVTLVVSKGPETENVSVISFLRMTPEQAKEKAEALKLTYGGITEEVYDAEVPEGYICYQSISVATEVPEGTTITFKVSKGQDPEAQPSEEPTTSPDAGSTSTPSTSPSPSTPGGSTQPVVPVSRNVTVELPDDGRETVSVRIQVGDNTTAYVNNSVDTSMKVMYPSVRGVGIQEVTIFIDEVAVRTYTEDFSS